jgi:hypothetical protein
MPELLSLPTGISLQGISKNSAHGSTSSPRTAFFGMNSRFPFVLSRSKNEKNDF